MAQLYRRISFVFNFIGDGGEPSTYTIGSDAVLTPVPFPELPTFHAAAEGEEAVHQAVSVIDDSDEE